MKSCLYQHPISYLYEHYAPPLTYHPVYSEVQAQKNPPVSIPFLGNHHQISIPLLRNLYQVPTLSLGHLHLRYVHQALRMALISVLHSSLLHLPYPWR